MPTLVPWAKTAPVSPRTSGTGPRACTHVWARSECWHVCLSFGELTSTSMPRRWELTETFQVPPALYCETVAVMWLGSPRNTHRRFLSLRVLLAWLFSLYLTGLDHLDRSCFETTVLDMRNGCDEWGLAATPCIPSDKTCFCMCPLVYGSQLGVSVVSRPLLPAGWCTVLGKQRWSTDSQLPKHVAVRVCCSIATIAITGVT